MVESRHRLADSAPGQPAHHRGHRQAAEDVDGARHRHGRQARQYLVRFGAAGARLRGAFGQGAARSELCFWKRLVAASPGPRRCCATESRWFKCSRTMPPSGGVVLFRPAKITNTAAYGRRCWHHGGFRRWGSRIHEFTSASLAFVFPGQGSQSVGMLAELAAAHAEVQATFEEASQGAGLDLWTLGAAGTGRPAQPHRKHPAGLARRQRGGVARVAEARWRAAGAAVRSQPGRIQRAGLCRRAVAARCRGAGAPSAVG